MGWTKSATLLAIILCGCNALLGLDERTLSTDGGNSGPTIATTMGSTGSSTSSASGVSNGSTSDTGTMPRFDVEAPPDGPDIEASSVPDAEGMEARPDVDGGSLEVASPVANFPTATVNLGYAACGGASVSRLLTINNSGNAALVVNATTNRISPPQFMHGYAANFQVAPSTLNVAAGQSGNLMIVATVAPSSTAGSMLTGSLILTTNDSSHAAATIPLSVTAQGLTLAWAGASPTRADFGLVPNNLAATSLQLTLTNTGNVTATNVAFGTPTDGQFSLLPAMATIPAGGMTTLNAGFAPNTLSQSLATSSITATGAICGMSVTSIAFSGQGSASNVTGWPSAAIDFGGNACGGDPPAGQSFVLTNSGNLAAHITGATVVGYAGYATDCNNGQTVPAGGSLTVHVTAPAIPNPSTVAGTFEATVTFTTDVANDTPHRVSLTEHAAGAILAFDTSPTTNFGTFGDVPVGYTASQTFNIVNSGNAAAANVSVTTTVPFGVMTSNFVSLASGISQSDTVTFAPSTSGGANAQLTIAADNLCQPVPAAIPLTGTGQGGMTSNCASNVLASTNNTQASSSQQGTAYANLPSNVRDGNLATRWESTWGAGTQWIVLDYGAPVFINRVQILWESGCAQNYDLQVSTDAANWTTINSITGNALAASPPGGMPPPTDWSKAVDSTGLKGVGRYLRVNMTQRCATDTMFGYSLWEMRAFGDVNAACTP